MKLISEGSTAVGCPGLKKEVADGPVVAAVVEEEEEEEELLEDEDADEEDEEVDFPVLSDDDRW